REHFQLNVDIVGEADVTADAELLAVAIETMRALGLSHDDVRARVSDRRLLRGLLAAIGVSEEQSPAVFAVIDKVERQPLELAYYTGIVFELFDARGELRAICGGGRYDDLLRALGDVDLPALGFGMGDVVLGELLRSRGLLPRDLPTPDYWVAYADAAHLGEA